MPVTQSAFKQALLDPDHPVPDGLLDASGAPAGKRFSVYRNNVAVSLTEALIQAFPTVHALLGDHNFRILAGSFLRSHPPRNPLMMHYGAEFPAFLSGFEPVRQYGYLPDIARLELLIRKSYHAADVVPIAPDTLGLMPPEQLMGATVRLAPAVQLLRSSWPVVQIREFNLLNGPKPEMNAEDVLVTRPDLDPIVVALPVAGATFVAALLEEKTFGQALTEAGTENETFDLGSTLAALLAGNAICDIIEG